MTAKAAGAINVPLLLQKTQAANSQALQSAKAIYAAAVAKQNAARATSARALAALNAAIAAVQPQSTIKQLEAAYTAAYNAAKAADQAAQNAAIYLQTAMSMKGAA